jgi:O-acetyl-ADP-ribose deacetylase
MMEAVISGVAIEVEAGDITRQNGFDAVVNAANAQLRPGGGVAGAIHAAAGPGLYEECVPLAPIKPGQAVITGGHRLPNKHVIHCLGPIYGVDTPSDELLADCYRNALRLADEHGLISVAFPAISTGVFGYPMAEAARVALAAVAETAASLRTVRRVRFVLRPGEALRMHEEALAALSK